MNADIVTDQSTLVGPPGRRIPLATNSSAAAPVWDLSQLIKMSMVHRSSEMVMFYDGQYFRYAAVNPSRITGRHNRKSVTNLVFYDGHAISYPTASLPGGLTPSSSSNPFNITNLSANYPAPQYPMWFMEQQN